MRFIPAEILLELLLIVDVPRRHSEAAVELFRRVHGVPLPDDMADPVLFPLVNPDEDRHPLFVFRIPDGIRDDLCVAVTVLPVEVDDLLLVVVIFLLVKFG